MATNIKNWVNSGAPYVWLSAGAVSVSIVMVTGLIALIAVRGLSHFWPAEVVMFDYYERPNQHTARLMGEQIDAETVPRSQLHEIAYEAEVIERVLIKTGNRRVTDNDFVWVLKAGMQNISMPSDTVVIEDRKAGHLYGFITELKLVDKSATEQNWQGLQESIAANNIVLAEIRHLEKNLIGGVNYQLERLRLKTRSLALKGDNTPEKLQAIAAKRVKLQEQYEGYAQQLTELYRIANQSSLTITTAAGQNITISLADVVRAWQPNAMGFFDKCRFYVTGLWSFLSADPREANTAGGIFPAIFGTVLMVMLMTVFVTPFGVVAAIYLHEYARQGLMTRLVRIAVNNLAGVPSVVYGVFGLGFFVYFLGNSIDNVFFPASLPAPTFGTPGLLWASLTLAILTVPVVIVATEEGLTRVPRAIREGSLALGATKAETMWRTVLPMTASAMITGLILAIARAAGEVAPLMLVGVVKLAPSLALDGNAPFLHLDRKFMHLGFHIYDVGFQSPNVEAAQPLVYATALLLVMLIIVLNLAAIKIRNNLRDKHRLTDQSL